MTDEWQRHERQRFPLWSEKDTEDALRLMKLLAASPVAPALQSPSNDTLKILTRAQLVQAALRELNVRRHRAEIFPRAMFGEPAWEILLLLYIEDQGQRLNIRGICGCLDVPMSSALRWLGYLQKAQLVRRELSPTDQRVIIARLTSKAIAALDLYFSKTGAAT